MVTSAKLELQALTEVTARAGSDPLLTQASSGNSSAKIEGELVIKESGRWMADAARDNIFVSLNLRDVRECMRHGRDPSGEFSGASLETAMHAMLPHRFVLHVHSVDAIAWAVRQDAVEQLRSRLDGLRWQWIPYAASGLPLALEIETALRRHEDTEVFVLGNHGLLVCACDVGALESLLWEVRRRLSIRPRNTQPADYNVLRAACDGRRWVIPDNLDLHALSTDEASRAILRGGFLYPCHAMLPSATATSLFDPVCRTRVLDQQYAQRAFLLIENFGLVVNRAARPAELAMLAGLAQVVQRVSPTTVIRYLTDGEVAAISTPVVRRYMDAANARQEHTAEAYSNGVS